MVRTNGDIRNDDIRQWPWQAQFAALLFVLAIAAFLIVLPVSVVRVLDVQYAFSSETDIWAAMIAILLGLTTMTVSGVFVFMTFRIDRGARLQAQKTAQKIAEGEARKAMKKYGENAVNAFKKELEDRFNVSKKKISDLYSSVKEEMSEVAEKTKTEVSEVAEKTKTEVSEVAEKTKTDVSQLADTVKTDVSQLADTVKTDVSQLADKSVKVVENQVAENDKRIREKFDDGLQEIGKLFETAWETAWEKAQEKAQETIDDAGETPGDGDAGDSNKE